MVTNLGGSLLMIMINGVTWYRMLISYLKHRKRRHAEAAAAAAAAVGKDA